MSTDPVTADRDLAERLTPFWAEAGLDVSYPCETADVLRMLEACDYIASGDDLLGWISAGLLPVPMVSGRRKWSPSHVYAAIAQCEGRRRWKPMSARHLFKATAAERAVWEAQIAGDSQPIKDTGDFDVEMLLHMLESSDERHIRHILRMAIQQKLKDGEF